MILREERDQCLGREADRRSRGIFLFPVLAAAPSVSPQPWEAIPQKRCQMFFDAVCCPAIRCLGLHGNFGRPRGPAKNDTRPSWLRRPACEIPFTRYQRLNLDESPPRFFCSSIRPTSPAAPAQSFHRRRKLEMRNRSRQAWARRMIIRGPQDFSPIGQSGRATIFIVSSRPPLARNAVYPICDEQRGW